jgi:hypothetical protein
LGFLPGADAAGNETHYGYDRAVRVSAVTNADSKVEYMACTDRSELHRTWGHTPYPVALETPRLPGRDSVWASPTAARQRWSTATTASAGGGRRPPGATTRAGRGRRGRRSPAATGFEPATCTGLAELDGHGSKSRIGNLLSAWADDSQSNIAPAQSNIAAGSTRVRAISTDRLQPTAAAANHVSLPKKCLLACNSGMNIWPTLLVFPCCLATMAGDDGA